MKLDINDPQVWNEWRELYDLLTDEEQKKFANDSEAKYPVQKHFTRSNYDGFFESLKGFGYMVLEIGGWKGELAAHCCEKNPALIKRWTNIDFCRSAVDKSVNVPGSYNVLCPVEFDWFKRYPKIPFDICISAHTIEHFSDDHFKLLVDYIDHIPMVVFEAPIKEEGDDWKDYGGSHKLTMGWRGVNAVMSAKGYLPKRVNEYCYEYRKAE